MSPTLYEILKFKLRDLVKNDFNISLSISQERNFIIKQQDNGIFRQIRILTDTNYYFNSYLIFVDCKGYKTMMPELELLLRNGFIYNNKHYVVTERSASMARNGILGFVDKEIQSKLNDAITMDLEIEKTVISKYVAYRGLMFSSCFFIEGVLPNIIIVDDYETTIPNQNIKYVIEKELSYTDKDTNELKTYINKDIEEGNKDIDICPADGSGINSHEISKVWAEQLGLEHVPCLYMIRLPFMKGLTISVDFKSFYKKRGIEFITDIWGIQHNINDIDCIWTKSMYKGIKYFNKYKDFRDWENYKNKVYKYNHALGIAKWNFRYEEEPIYTRVNYQYMQTLNITHDDMLELADYSKEWAEKIISGNEIYTYNFLGLNSNSANAQNKYMKAILLNPRMLNDIRIQNYLYTLLKKYIQEFKIGKLWIKGNFKVVIPDIILLLEHIGGLAPVGCLKANEFYGYGLESKEHLIDRNPHICRSEHTILKCVNNDLINEYLSHLENVCMLNGYDITMRRLNGCDTDGDLVFITDNAIMKNGVIPNLPIVIDIDDKITAIESTYNLNSVIAYLLMSLDSRIGEISNVATCYLNKQTKNEKQLKIYDNYVCLLSVINGKEIDFAKTGIRWNIPYYIAKFARPLPYFMKYAGKYYKSLKTFSKAQSNLNKLCWNIEKWEKQFKFKKSINDVFDLLIDLDVLWNQDKFEQVIELYKVFNKEMADAKKQQGMVLNNENYSNYFSDLSKIEILNTEINWGAIYEKYINLARELVSNPRELANYGAEICYRMYPKRSNLFIWVICEEGLFLNLEKNRDYNLKLPHLTSNKNDIEYLGKYYKLSSLFN